jgi:Ca-activated chloride channel family protein
VVLITDGFIGFEREIVDAIAAELPRGCRLHTIGVGGAPNRSLTRPAARVGGGVELVIGPEKDAEDAERVAQRLLARTTAPLVTDLVVTGDAVVQTAPVRLPDMFAGAPSLVSVQLDPAGGTVVVRGETAGGPFERQLQAPALTLGEGNPAIATLFGRERVEDLEIRCGARGDTRDADREIERIGLDFQIATRLTSWVAITETATVDPGGPSRRQVMPHEIPFGADIEGFGLRAGSAAPTMEPRLALKQRLGLGAKRPRASIKLGRAGGAMPAAPSESSDDPFAAMNALGGVGSGPPLSLDELLAAPYAPKRRQPLWPRLVLALLILAIAAAIVFGLWSWLG